MDDLPDDLLFQILVRLPSKLVHQCKCISKNWYSLISESEFISRYTSHNNDKAAIPPPWGFMFYAVNRVTWNRKLVGYSDEESIVKSSGFSLSFLPCFNPKAKIPIAILASCNDVLLCCVNPFEQRVLFVCNPLTKQWIELPPVPQFHKFVKVGLICHPIEDSSVRINYTVVRITEFWGYHTSFNVETFSSTTGKWIESEVALESSRQLCASCHGLYSVIVYNGMLHWWCDESVILVYDPSRQSCRLLDKPNDPLCCYNPRLGVFHDQIRIYNYAQSFDYYAIWELEDYNLGKWVLLHRLHFVDINTTKLSMKNHWNLNPMALHPTDGDSIFLFCDEFIVLFNMKKRNMEVVNAISEAGTWMYPNINVITITLPSWPTQIL